MKYIAYIIVLFFFIQCKKDNNKVKEITKIKNEVKTVEIKQSESNKDEIFKNQFIYKNDTIIQSLMFNNPKDGKINFKIVLNNLLKSKINHFEGTAKILAESDGESDVDDEGNGYFVDEYQYLGTCKVVLRIDSDENKRARIKVINCKEKDTLSKYTSLGIMYSN